MTQTAPDASRRSLLPTSPPLVQFWGVYPNAQMPVPARERLLKTLPLSAVQMCPPVTTASSLGWLVFPPIGFAVQWSGDELSWTRLDDGDVPLDDWQVVGGKGVRLPEILDAISGLAEPRRTIALELGLDKMPLIDPHPSDPRDLQIITGVSAVTAPGWAIQVRPLPNQSLVPESYDIFEGVIESEWSAVTIPVMVRLRHERRVVRFPSGRPIAALQPVATASCTREATTIQQSGGGMDTWPESVWTSHIEGRIERQSGQSGGYRRRQLAYFHERPEMIGDAPDRTAADV